MIVYLKFPTDEQKQESSDVVLVCLVLCLFDSDRGDLHHTQSIKLVVSAFQNAVKLKLAYCFVEETMVHLSS